jgi:hypothetical protein
LVTTPVAWHDLERRNAIARRRRRARRSLLLRRVRERAGIDGCDPQLGEPVATSISE